MVTSYFYFSIQKISNSIYGIYVYIINKKKLEGITGIKITFKVMKEQLLF